MQATHANGAGQEVPASERVEESGGAQPLGIRERSKQVSHARRTYIDVLRGVAVLVMIEAHVIDSWTRDADRQLHYYRQSMVLGGFAAPLFLFMAGIGVGRSVQSKARRRGDDRAAARIVTGRGLQIFALAFLFRLQSLVLSHGAPRTLLKVDILNVMGPAIAGCAILWQTARGTRARAMLFAAATALAVFASPAVRAMTWLARLPDAIAAYLRPIPGLTNFTLLPWVGFVSAGVMVGLAVDAARTPASDRRVNLWLGVSGIVIALVAWQMSFLPPLDSRSNFWTTSASFFFIRLGLMVASLAVAYLWEQRPSAGRRWSPLQALGRSSLFVYWIHVEMVYGLVSLPLHRAFTLTGAWLALAVFSGFMVTCVITKDRLNRWWRGTPVTRQKAFAYVGSSSSGVKPSHGPHHGTCAGNLETTRQC